jgi:hypothetical protein
MTRAAGFSSAGDFSAHFARDGRAITLAAIASAKMTMAIREVRNAARLVPANAAATINRARLPA